MTRTYALKRLLEHGAMTRREIWDCTLWSRRELDSALAGCMRSGLVRRVSALGRFAYVAVSV